MRPCRPFDLDERPSASPMRLVRIEEIGTCLSDVRRDTGGIDPRHPSVDSPRRFCQAISHAGYLGVRSMRDSPSARPRASSSTLQKECLPVHDRLLVRPCANPFISSPSPTASLVPSLTPPSLLSII